MYVQQSERMNQYCNTFRVEQPLPASTESLWIDDEKERVTTLTLLCDCAYRSRGGVRCTDPNSGGAAGRSPRARLASSMIISSCDSSPGTAAHEV